MISCNRLSILSAPVMRKKNTTVIKTGFGYDGFAKGFQCISRLVYLQVP